jgi:hypothetical protein
LANTKASQGFGVGGNEIFMRIWCCEYTKASREFGVGRNEIFMRIWCCGYGHCLANTKASREFGVGRNGNFHENLGLATTNFHENLVLWLPLWQQPRMSFR